MSDNLAKHAIAAITWSYVGVAAFVVLQLTANIAYARLLGPFEFGLFASGLLVFGFIKTIVEAGLGSALVQAPVLDSRTVRVTFTKLLAAGGVACAALIGTSGTIADALREPRLAPILRCFAIGFVLFPVYTVCTALMSRELRQKQSQIGNVLAYGIGYVAVGLTIAALGYGAWSPIAGFFAQLAINSSIAYYYTRPDLRLARTGTVTIRNLSVFGLRAMLTDVVNWFIYSIDNLLVQRIFGTLQFGIYSLAYGIVRTPVDHFSKTIQSVLFPASARIREDAPRLGRGYIAAIDLVAVVCVPMFVTIAVVSRTFVAALYGARWVGAEAVLAPLALAMPFQAISTVSSALLWGIALVGKDLRVHLVAAIALLVTLLLCAQISFVAVAWGVLAVYLLRSLLMMRTLIRAIQLPPGRLVVAGRGAIIVSLLIVPAIWALDAFLARMNCSAIVSLATEIGCAAVLWVGCVGLAGSRFLSPELIALAQTAAAQLIPPTWRRRKAPAR